LHEEAKTTLKGLQYIINEQIKDTSRGSLVSLIIIVFTIGELGAHSREQRRLSSFVGDLVGSGADRKPFTRVVSLLSRHYSSKDSIYALLGAAVDIAIPFSKVIAEVVDFYLDSVRDAQRTEIIDLANRPSEDEEAQKLLLGYMLESQSKHFTGN
jgi:hypothetical protein